jgi:glycosyltransferase involved in cell wall biosynthesis
MLRFGEVMERGLSERGITTTLIQPDPLWLGNRSSAAGFGKWMGYVDKFLRFPQRLRSAAQAHDVVHILDHSNAPYCRSISDMPHLVTCHDLLAVRSALGEFPQNHTRWSGRRLQAHILASLKQARQVACESRATIADVQRLTGIPDSRVAFVPLGLNFPYGPLPADVVARHLNDLGLNGVGRYLLHIGGNHWYKNRNGVLRIAAALRRLPGHEDIRLVMAGEALGSEAIRISEQEGLGTHLHAVGGVTNEQLNALYLGALGLVFPSFHEGFGWPVIEAQACGCPAFISDRPPLPEVAGETAVRFDPNNATAAAQAIAAGLVRRASLVEAARENVARYTNQAMIDGYLALYQRLIA